MIGLTIFEIVTVGFGLSCVIGLVQVHSHIWSSGLKTFDFTMVLPPIVLIILLVLSIIKKKVI